MIRACRTAIRHGFAYLLDSITICCSARPESRELGYGFTSLMTHEVGHHAGLSHPHDGYDPQLGVDYSPIDEFYSSWPGDETDTLMSYLDITQRFGVFDRDNIASTSSPATSTGRTCFSQPSRRQLTDTVRGLLQRANASTTARPGTLPALEFHRLRRRRPAHLRTRPYRSRPAPRRSRGRAGASKQRPERACRTKVTRSAFQQLIGSVGRNSHLGHSSPSRTALVTVRPPGCRFRRQGRVPRGAPAELGAELRHTGSGASATIRRPAVRLAPVGCVLRRVSKGSGRSAPASIGPARAPSRAEPRSARPRCARPPSRRRRRRAAPAASPAAVPCRRVCAPRT